MNKPPIERIVLSIIFIFSITLAALIYASLIFILVGKYGALNHGMFIATVVFGAFAVSLAVQHIFTISQKHLLRIFFRSASSYQETIQKISRAVSSIIKFDEILNIIIPAVIDMLDPKEISFLIHNKAHKKFKGLPSSRIKRHLERYKILDISDESPVISFLKKEGRILVRSKIDDETANKLGLLYTDMEVWVPVILKDEIVGLILLGKKSTSASYTDEDVNILNTLAGHIALSYENASLYEDILNLKNYNEMILNHISYPIITTNLRGEINTLNSASEKIFGISLNEIESQDYKTFFKGNPDLLSSIGKALEGNEVLGFEGYVTSKDQATIPVSITAISLFDIKGRRIGVLIVLHDLTGIKKLEEHVRRSDKLAALGTMAAGMAHEIKNPLSSMKVLTQLMAQRFHETEYRQKFSEIMPKEISRIDRIVESLLGYARTNSPKIEQVAINEIISESLNFLDEKIKKNNINVTFDGNDLPPILGDSQHFLQVFVNLILNAVQAMPDGGMIKISTNNIENTGEILIQIDDSGCGIPKEDMAYLFDPFFTTKHEGTGLGLTIVHGIIDAHNGRVEVESTFNKGTTFKVYLPVKQKDIKKINILRQI